MAVRVTDVMVKEILGRHYDAAKAPSLTPFITAANLLTNRVYSCATQKEYTLLTEELTEIERWLAAHFYERSDQMFSSKSTAGASATFMGQTTMHLESTFYGQTAMDLDTSGCLAAFNAGQATAGGFWAGTREGDERSYDERNLD